MPVVAASDYVRAVPEQIRGWVHGSYRTLGTDGFGRSDTRANLRRFFEVDRYAVVLAALSQVDAARRDEAIARYGLDAACAPSWER